MDERVPEYRDSHASSCHELSLEPTPTRSADLGKHCVYTHFPKDRNCEICEGVGLVKRVHTLLGGVHRFATNLKEVEEVRQEVREVKDEEKGEINVEGEPHTS